MLNITIMIQEIKFTKKQLDRTLEILNSSTTLDTFELALILKCTDIENNIMFLSKNSLLQATDAINDHDLLLLFIKQDRENYIQPLNII